MSLFNRRLLPQNHLLGLVILSLSFGSTFSNARPSVSSEELSALTKSIGKVLKEQYIFPNHANEIAKLLEENRKSGLYENYREHRALSEKLTEDIRSVNNDVHLSVSYTPPEGSGGKVMRRMKSNGKLSKKQLESMQRENFGFKDVRLLEGNVGYLNLSGFYDPRYAGETAVSAMAFLNNSNAIIIDLRENRGGAGEMYQLLSSYFFDEGPVLLNEISFPLEDRKYQTWTLPHIPGARRPDVDLYILTSHQTGSAAEVFSYAMKHYKRATLVGEVTVGAANPVSPTLLPNGFVILLSKAQAINPVTKRNWEGVGVIPHVKTPKQDALNTAHLLALQNLATKEGEKSTYFIWHSEMLAAKTQSVALSNDRLQSYVGKYQARNGDVREIELKKGKLFYGESGKEKEALITLNLTTFTLTSNNHFKLKINHSNNKVSGITRQFLDGYSIDMSKSD